MPGVDVDLDRRASAATASATPDRPRRSSAAALRSSRPRSRTRARRRRSTGSEPSGRRPVRAAQGPHHRLVGRHGRRPRIPSRPVRAAPPSRSTTGCSAAPTAPRPAGDGVRVRMLKDFAFHVVGTGEDARELDRGLGQVALAQARATGSWRTIVAPPGEHRPLHAVGNELIEALVAGARDALAEARGRPARPTTSRSSRTGAPRPARGPTTCASTCTTCRRSRIASPRSWAARRGS